MPILNYTTTVPVQRTVQQIMSTLGLHGATKILADYDGQGQITGLSFMANTFQGEIAFRLPVNTEGVYGALLKSAGGGQVPKTFGDYRRQASDKEQAKRIAWRILKDWIEAQMAILEAEMVKMEEIFLPYMLTDNDHTVFQRLQERGLPQLMSGVKGG